MKGRKILVFSRDPGGTNALLPLIEPLRERGNEVVVYGKDAALAIYRRAAVTCIDICDAVPLRSADEIDELVRNLEPNLIVTGTSSEDFTERQLWSAAKRAQITSFAVLDQWTNYRLRLIREGGDPMSADINGNDLVLPSFFFVMDEFAREEMCRLGIAREKLIVTGQPFFDHIRQSGEQLGPDEVDKLRRQLTGDRDGQVIVFASQPIASLHKQNGIAEDYWGYTEETVLGNVIECLGKLTEELATSITLVIRLHPKDRSDAYRDAMANSPKRVEVIFDRSLDSSLLLQAADVVVGMFSMLLLEAAILGRPILSVQIGLKRENPFVLDRVDSARSIVTKTHLEKALREVLQGKNQPVSPMKFEFGATERIVAYLEGHK